MLDRLFPARRRHRELMDELRVIKTMLAPRQSRIGGFKRVGGDDDREG